MGILVPDSEGTQWKGKKVCRSVSGMKINDWDKNAESGQGLGVTSQSQLKKKKKKGGFFGGGLLGVEYNQKNGAELGGCRARCRKDGVGGGKGFCSYSE